MKLDFICEKGMLHPILGYVYVTKDWCIATDAIVMARVSTGLVFDLDFIKKIPDSGVLIHHEDWSKLRNVYRCKWMSDSLIAVSYMNKTKEELIAAVNPDSFPKPFPKMDSILSRCQPCDRPFIQFDYKKLKNLCDALDIQWPVIRFHNADLCADIDYVMTVGSPTDVSVFGLLMPVKLEK